MQIYPYQQECLDAIESARQAGSKKALVVMATGLGKTVVSALQLERMLAEQPGRVLYVTHQNEILRQARRTYETLLPPEITYGYFHGEEKHLHKVDVLFASFQTMVTSRELFAHDEFTYVIVDEAHHVHAETYRPTVEYFQPRFMIGLTATPDRADRKDITELMGEPVFHLDLFEALAGRHLTPINYRLMTDELQNLEVLETPAGKLSIAELNRTIFVPKRDEEIVRIIEEKLNEVTNPRTILFCSSVAHAEQLGELMPYAQVLHSKLRRDQRERRIKAFRNGHSRIIITVDMFNEGIDIPEANVVVFLRSTASQTIYLQQLGRGLRRAEGKDEVLVLDFVANCERIEMIDTLRKGVTAVSNKPTNESEPGVLIKDIVKLSVDGGRFDERLVNLIDIVGRVRKGYTKAVIAKQVLDLARRLGRTPRLIDVVNDPHIACGQTITEIFGKSWNGTLKEIGLTPNQPSYTKEEVIDQLKNKRLSLGRLPSHSDINRDPSMASTTGITRIFRKSLLKIYEDLGWISPQLSREDAADRLKNLAQKLGRAPLEREAAADPSLPSTSALRRLFNESSWGRLLLKAGLEPKRVRLSLSQLASRVDEIRRSTGSFPRSDKLDEHEGLPSYRTILRITGTSSWGDALRVIENTLSQNN